MLVWVSGQRALAKPNAFDLVVTVALGSALATVVLNRQTSITEGVLALALLLLLQFASSWAATRWCRVRRFLKAKPLSCCTRAPSFMSSSFATVSRWTNCVKQYAPRGWAVWNRSMPSYSRRMAASV